MAWTPLAESKAVRLGWTRRHCLQELGQSGNRVWGHQAALPPC